MNLNEAMKAELLSEIDGKLPGMDVYQMRRISTALDAVLARYDVQKRCTELTLYQSPVPREVQEYLVAKRIEGMAESTLRNAAITLKMFFTTVRKSPAEVTTGDVRQYLYEYQMYRHISNRSLEEIRIRLSSFFTWLADNEILEKNVMRTVRPIRYEKKQREAMTALEAEILRGACRDIRERAMLEFMFSTACRCGELVKVRMNEIDWNSNTVLLHGKGSKDRPAYLSSRCIPLLKRYLAEREHESEMLFARTKRPYTAMQVKNVERIVDTLEERTQGQIRVHVTPHVIRHTAATLALQRGMSLEEIQVMLGHADINTTRIYAEVADENVRRSHAKYVI